MDTSEAPCPRTYPMCAKPRTLKYTQRLCNTPSKLTPASALLRLYLSDESHDTGPVMDTDSRGTTTIIEFVQGSVQRIFRSVVQAVNHSASIQGETSLITANLLDMKECLEACKADSAHADPKMRLHLDQFLHIVNTSLDMTDMIQKTCGSKLAILHESYQFQLTMCYQLVRSEYEQMSKFSELKTYRFHFDHAVPTASISAQTSNLATANLGATTSLGATNPHLFPTGSINTGALTATQLQANDEVYDDGSYTSTPMDEGVYTHHDSHGDGTLSVSSAQAAQTSWLKKQRTRFSRHK